MAIVFDGLGRIGGLREAGLAWSLSFIPPWFRLRAFKVKAALLLGDTTFPVENSTKVVAAAISFSVHNGRFVSGIDMLTGSENDRWEEKLLKQSEQLSVC